MKMIVGATWRARSNRRAICCSLSPYHLLSRSDDLVAMKFASALARRRLGEQGLAGARRAVEQEALGRADAEPAERLGMLQRQLDAFAQPVARLVEAADIVPARSSAPRPSPRASPRAGRASAHCRNRCSSTDSASRISVGIVVLGEVELGHDPPHRLERRLAGQRGEVGADEAVGAARELVEIDVGRRAACRGCGCRGSRGGPARRARRRRSRGRSGRGGAAPRRSLRAGWWRR